MKRKLLGLLLALPLGAYAQGHEARAGYCFNTTNGWIPMLTGVSGATIAPTPAPINLYGQNAGTAYAMPCDASGNLILSNAPSTLCHSTTDIVNTGNTTQNVIATCTIAANTIGNNSRLLIHSAWTGPADAASCTIGIKFGTVNTTGAGNLIFDVAFGQASTEILYANINERNANSAQIIDTFGVRNVALVNPVGVQALALPTTGTLYVVFIAQQPNTTDSCVLNEYDVVLWP